MTQEAVTPGAPLSALLTRLRDVLEGQAEALGADDFDGLERLDVEREQLVLMLGHYTPADAAPEDRALLDQVGALDQRLLVLARESLAQAGQELRDIQRGRGALAAYRQRGQTLIRDLTGDR